MTQSAQTVFIHYILLYIYDAIMLEKLNEKSVFTLKLNPNQPYRDLGFLRSNKRLATG